MILSFLSYITNNKGEFNNTSETKDNTCKYRAFSVFSYTLYYTQRVMTSSMCAGLYPSLRGDVPEITWYRDASGRLRRPWSGARKVPVPTQVPAPTPAQAPAPAPTFQQNQKQAVDDSMLEAARSLLALAGGGASPTTPNRLSARVPTEAPTKKKLKRGWAKGGPRSHQQ